MFGPPGPGLAGLASGRGRRGSAGPSRSARLRIMPGAGMPRIRRGSGVRYGPFTPSITKC